MLSYEITIRLSAFILTLLFFMLLEQRFPKRLKKISQKKRWQENLLLTIINSSALRLLVPFSVASSALFSAQNHMGLFNYFAVHPVIAVLLSLLLLDFVIYLQHRFFHHNALLWRLHKVHHIDQDIDVTTGLRFHPIEIALSLLLKCLVVILFGIPFIAVVIFEIVLNSVAMFNHSNLKLPQRLDNWLRLVIVTPDMHRVHHSTLTNEHNRNFGFNLSCWDKLCQTYQAQPSAGHQQMKIGLNSHQSGTSSGLWHALILPFQGK